MKYRVNLTHEFVEYIPKELKDRTIYVSIAFATAAHKCCCGCGKEVITPLSPTDWRLIFDGRTISLEPSIGNWSFACQSHYWIKNDRVIWAPRWTPKEIIASRNYNSRVKETYFNTTKNPTIQDTITDIGGRLRGKQNFWQKIKKWLF